MTTVPFHRDSSDGFAESLGLLILEDEGVVIQFRTQDAILGVAKGDVEEVDVPFTDIDDFVYKKTLFGARIRIEVNDMNYADDLPFCEINTITMSIKKRDRERAEQVVLAARLRLSERAYRSAIKDD